MCFAENVYKITSVNFDTSTSMIFLTSPDTYNMSVANNIKLVKLQNPKRIYFDLNSAHLVSNKENWYFNSGGIKQIKINQFSTNPYKVRVVMYVADNYDVTKLNLLKINNNIVINLKGTVLKSEYFQNIYSDSRTSSSEFYENLSISNEEIDNINAQAKKADSAYMIDQIQKSFQVQTQPVKTSAVTKDLKLKSKYFLNTVNAKSTGFLVSGFGTVNVEKPMYLSNPSRVVFDIPNAVLNPSLVNKTFPIGEESIKVSQFSQNKVRVIIYSPETTKYFPIFSSDGQSMFFVKENPQNFANLFNTTNDAVAYYVNTNKDDTSDFTIVFSSPVVHGVKRSGSDLTINFYNTSRFNQNAYKNTVENSAFKNMSLDILPKIGLKLVLPLSASASVNTYLGADGKTVKISLKGMNVTPQATAIAPATQTKILFVHRNKGAQRVVVLDAGHGGTDFGAMRAGINEKDINLDVAKRVKSILETKGVKVIMTRSTDVFIPLQQRTQVAATAKPDIFVSVHVNASVRPEICGVETHYYHDESLDLASSVHSKIASYIKSPDRGLFKSKFYVINHTEVPAILCEIGFISNDDERNDLITDKRKQQTAKAIAEGIMSYFKLK
ncbi:MAG: N-acetylmuramoyl-L-alanine amidase [bacterium]|nr:N-acetylmuramoyl-L-alanine amidase [bacterium]